MCVILYNLLDYTGANEHYVHRALYFIASIKQIEFVSTLVFNEIFYFQLCFNNFKITLNLF